MLASHLQAVEKKDGAELALKSVYKVEDAELPLEAIGNKSMSAPLPPTIPMERRARTAEVLTNIVQNLDFKSHRIVSSSERCGTSALLGNEAWSEKARNAWFRDFKSAPSRAVLALSSRMCCMDSYASLRLTTEVIGDAFCALLLSELEAEGYPFAGVHLERITKYRNSAITALHVPTEDFFFRCYADAVAQAVLYAMFLAYPKSR
eukprot:3636794-Amphidinium_carterae.1